MTNFSDFYISPPLVGQQDDLLDITVYVNSRGTMSPIKTIGFEPLTLQVHENYNLLGSQGKELFRRNAYTEYLQSNAG